MAGGDSEGPRGPGGKAGEEEVSGSPWAEAGVRRGQGRVGQAEEGLGGDAQVGTGADQGCWDRKARGCPAAPGS